MRRRWDTVLETGTEEIRRKVEGAVLEGRRWTTVKVTREAFRMLERELIQKARYCIEDCQEDDLQYLHLTISF